MDRALRRTRSWCWCFRRPSAARGRRAPRRPCRGLPPIVCTSSPFFSSSSMSWRLLLRLLASPRNMNRYSSTTIEHQRHERADCSMADQAAAARRPAGGLAVACATIEDRAFKRAPFARNLAQCRHASRGPELTPRIVRAELLKSPLADRPADVRHQPLVEPHIMHGNEHRAKHLAGEKKVPDRPAGESPAGVAVAAGLDRAGIAR